MYFAALIYRLQYDASHHCDVNSSSHTLLVYFLRCSNPNSSLLWLLFWYDFWKLSFGFPAFSEICYGFAFWCLCVSKAYGRYVVAYTDKINLVDRVVEIFCPLRFSLNLRLYKPH